MQMQAFANCFRFPLNHQLYQEMVVALLRMLCPHGLEGAWQKNSHGCLPIPQ